MDRRQLIVTVQVNEASNVLIALLHKNKVKMTQMHRTKEQLIFQVNKKDLRLLRKIRRQTKAKLTLRYVNEQAVWQKTWQTWLGALCAICVPIVASTIIWTVEVDGPTPELVADVAAYVEETLHIEAPILKNDFPAEMHIRQQLMAQFPSLAWVHFQKQKSRVYLTLHEAPKVKNQIDRQKTHLIARTSGIVTHHFISAGRLAVSINSTVKQGDLLVNGVIQGPANQVVTGARGEVFADYWLDTSFELPRKVKYYTASNGEWLLTKSQEQVNEEIPLPTWLKKHIRIIKKRQYILHEQVIEEKDVETLILPLLQEKILQQKPAKTTIKSQKVLRIAIDNDTVKGQVLYLVNENIAQPIPIDQGD